MVSNHISVTKSFLEKQPIIFIRICGLKRTSQLLAWIVKTYDVRGCSVESERVLILCTFIGPKPIKIWANLKQY